MWQSLREQAEHQARQNARRQAKAQAQLVDLNRRLGKAQLGSAERRHLRRAVERARARLEKAALIDRQ